MSQPSAKELLARLNKIDENDAKTGKKLNESGPEDNTGFDKGKEVGPSSKDDHSEPVKRVRQSGANEAPRSYDGNDKDLDSKTGNERKPGAENAPEEFEGSEKAISDNHKRKAGGKATVPAAEGAAKEFGAFRERIRSAMYGAGGLSLNDKLNKGNDGSLK